MSAQANTKLIGGFVVGALVLAMAAIATLGSANLFAETRPCVAYFDGSLAGLTVGSPVLFRGARIGEVTSIVFRYDVPAAEVDLPVFFELDASAIEFVGGDRPQGGEGLKILIEGGLRAQLVVQSMITGVLTVQLDFFPDVPIDLVGGDEGVVEIPTAPSMKEQLNHLFKELQDVPVEDLVNDVRTAVQGFNELVRSPDITKAIKDVDATVLEFKKLASDVDAQVDPIVEVIDTTGDEAKAALKQARESIAKVEATLNGTLSDYRTLGNNVNERVGPVVEDLHEALTTATSALRQAESTLKTVEGFIEQDSPTVYRLNEALSELTSALRSIRELADYLEQHPDSILKGK